MAAYEMKIQSYKTEAIESLKDEFKDVKDFIFTDYRGLTVSQITQLRDKLREQNASLKVVKNRFAKLALKALEKESADEYLVGPTAIALARDESGPVAKSILDFGKEAPISIKGGIIGDKIFSLKEVEAFSRLPGKMELIARLMGTMRAPVQNVVYILNAIPTKLVRTLQAVADKKQAEGN
ncbi:MAG: 50S ribosomal protein L10 [Spirochaetales bacterium]|nr:50S ribosomal protein L10 [Spirochaetales bacterium]